MRSFLVAVLILSGCHHEYWGPPRGPVTQCNGMATSSPMFGSVVTSGNSSCETFPAERCNPQHPTFREDTASGLCAQAEAKRQEHNDAEQSAEYHERIAGIVFLVLAVGVVIAGCAGGACN